MTGVDYRQLGDALVELCRQAGSAIADMYQRVESLEVSRKADSSPVTEADHLSHRLLVAGLEQLTPGWPILSEEAPLPVFDERRRWSRYWLVDPLDGTREFIQRTGEFTINIALIENGVPVLGVIGVPMEHRVYLGIPGDRALSVGDHTTERLAVAPLDGERVRVMASNRHRGRALEACLEHLHHHFTRVETLRAGSALKFCRLAEGAGDLYPRFSPCSEWDTGAGHALLVAAGGQVLDMDFRPLRYNTTQSVASPHFYALGDSTLDWPAILGSN